MELHSITAESFAIIDREVGNHSWSEPEYAIVRRAIHATADFDLIDLFSFSSGAIAAGIAALRHMCPVVVDVRMVSVGIESTLAQIGYEKIHCALDYSTVYSPLVTEKAMGELMDQFMNEQRTNPLIHPDHSSLTRTAKGMYYLARQFPQAVFVIGNAPTALLALTENIQTRNLSHEPRPSLVIGVPVGFVAVTEAKQRLADLDVPQIQVRGRKGGSAIAASIVNALAYLSANQMKP